MRINRAAVKTNKKMGIKTMSEQDRKDLQILADDFRLLGRKGSRDYRK